MLVADNTLAFSSRIAGKAFSKVSGRNSLQRGIFSFGVARVRPPVFFFDY